MVGKLFFQVGYCCYRLSASRVLPRALTVRLHLWAGHLWWPARKALYRCKNQPAVLCKCLSCLGQYYFKLSDYVLAARVWSEASEAIARHYGSNSLRLIDPLLGRAAALRARQEFVGVTEIYETALAIAEQGNSTHFVVYQFLPLLQVVVGWYCSLGLFNEAEDLLRRKIDLRELLDIESSKKYEDSICARRNDLYALRAVLVAQGKHEEAQNVAFDLLLVGGELPPARDDNA